MRGVRRELKEAQAQTQRDGVRLKDVERQRAKAQEEAQTLRDRLQVEESTRLKVEAASVQTLNELRQAEELRWESERQCQAAKARCTELERQAQRAADEAAERAAESQQRCGPFVKGWEGGLV